jgi:hypothetical protein
MDRIEHKRKSEMSPNELKSYNANKSKLSYMKNKGSISNRRILARVINGHDVSTKTIRDKDRKWSVDELNMLHKAKENRFKQLYVPQRDHTFSTTYNDRIKELSKSKPEPDIIKDEHYYQLQKEDKQTDAFSTTKHNANGKIVTYEQCKHIFKVAIELQILAGSKHDTQKKINTLVYLSRLRVILNIFGTDNLLDLYVYPERFHNKLLTSHLDVSSVKDYVSTPVVLYNTYCKIKNSFPNHYTELNYIPDLVDIVHIEQINKIKQYIKQGINLAKDNELMRVDESQYFSWNDLQWIPYIIEQYPHRNKTKWLRDRVIATFYIKQMVLRDNLGSIKISEVPIQDRKVNYLDISKRILYLRDYKTCKKYHEIRVRIFDDVMQKINEYISHMKPIVTKAKIPDLYLITKDNGEMYSNGKLSAYINKMFQQYTGLFNFTINHLRHSFATRYKSLDRYHNQYGFTVRLREFFSRHMQHSSQQHDRYIRSSPGNMMRIPTVQNLMSTDDRATDRKQNPLENATCYLVWNPIGDNDVRNVVVSVGRVQTNPNANIGTTTDEYTIITYLYDNKVDMYVKHILNVTLQQPPDGLASLFVMYDGIHEKIKCLLI